MSSRSQLYGHDINYGDPLPEPQKGENYFWFSQNGTINTTLTGATFYLRVDFPCSNKEFVSINYDTLKLDFLGGVDTSLYRISNNKIISIGGNTQTCNENCEPLQMALAFRFKPGVTCDGSIAEFSFRMSFGCEDIISDFTKTISAKAENYWKIDIEERPSHLSYLQSFEREWVLSYYQDFTNATAVNGIMPQPGIGTLNLSINEVSANLTNCNNGTLAITGFTQISHLNPFVPNPGYTAPTIITNTLDYSLNTVLGSSSNSKYYYFFKGEILTCSSCEYDFEVKVEGELSNSCDVVELEISTSESVEYVETLTLEGGLSNVVLESAYTQWSPGCSGAYMITFINRGNTTITEFVLIDTFPISFLNFEQNEINHPSKFDLTVIDSLIYFTLKDGETLPIQESFTITIPFTIQTSSLPFTSVTNTVSTFFDAEFPSDTLIDHCGNPIQINEASGQLHSFFTFDIEEPMPVSDIRKCVLNTSINIDEEQEFIIYVLNNGSVPLISSLTDQLIENNLENISAVEYYSGSIMSSNLDALSCEVDYNLSDSLQSNFNAVFDNNNTWHFEIPANCSYDEYNILGIKFKATQKPAESGSNEVILNDSVVKSSSVSYNINKFARLSVDKSLNTAIGNNDWDHQQTFDLNSLFEYKVVVRNTGSIIANQGMIIKDLVPECVEIQNVTVNDIPTNWSTNQYEHSSTFYPGDSVVIIIEAKYVENSSECINKAQIIASTYLGSINTWTNEAEILLDSCSTVDIIITDQYIYPRSTTSGNDLCCFEFGYTNMYPVIGAFECIYFKNVPSKYFLYSENGNLVSRESDTSLYIWKYESFPNVSNPHHFITLCFDQMEFAEDRLLEFQWMDVDKNVICTSEVTFTECEETDVFGRYNTENIDNYDIVVSPNPTTSSINIFVNHDEIYGISTVYNASGHEIMKKNLEFNNRATTLDVTSFSQGMYIMKILYPSGKSALIKFVKL